MSHPLMTAASNLSLAADLAEESIGDLFTSPRPLPDGAVQRLTALLTGATNAVALLTAEIDRAARGRRVEAPRAVQQALQHPGKSPENVKETTHA